MEKLTNPTRLNAVEAWNYEKAMVRDIVVFMHITLCKVVLLASCDIRSEVFPFSIITISTSTNTPYSVLVLPDSMCDNRNPSIEERIGDALQSAIHSA